MNPERFRSGLVLPFTHKRTKFEGLVLSPEILNPESKVGTVNPKTFESRKFCRCYTLFSRTKMGRYPKESKVIVVFRMAIDGSRWKPPRSVTGLGSLFICSG